MIKLESSVTGAMITTPNIFETTLLFKFDHEFGQIWWIKLMKQI